MRKKKYDMNLLSVTAMGIGSVVGAGIFALLGQVVLQAGNLSYYSFLIAGAAALFSGYSYARLAGAYPDSGGLTDYFNIAFKTKWVVGSLALIYMITSAVSVSMMAKSFGIYCAELFPTAAHPQLIVNTAAAVIIIALAILNMMGADEVGKTEVLMVGFKFTVLIGLIIAAFFKFDYIPDQRVASPTLIDFWGSIGITFFAYAGYGIITNAAADVAEPKKTIARAIYLTILIVILLYTSLAFVILHYIPATRLFANPDTAVATAAQEMFGEWGYAVLYTAAVVAFISGISATYFSIFRISYALSQDHILPKFYSQRFWRRGTYGNILTVSLTALATVLFNFNAIVNLASAAYLVCYLAVFAANWKLRRETRSSAVLILAGMGLMIFIFTAFIVSIM